MAKYELKYKPSKKGLFYNEKTSSSMKTKETIKRSIIYIVLVVISILWLLPFIYLVIQSFAVSYSAELIVPKQWTINNYRALFDTSLVMNLAGKEIHPAEVYPFWRWMLNTFFIALAVAVLQTTLTLMTSYAFSRLQFKTRKKYMKLILVIGMFPGFLGMIITYFILQSVGLSSGVPGIFGLILVYIAGSAMNYYISKGFFDTISKSLDEAAMIDGANKNTIFWRVIMPLSKPIIVYTVLMAFLAPWGDYMFASVIAAGDVKMFNVAVGLQQMLTKESGTAYFPIFCAAGVTVSIPIVILFFLLQRYYVEGVTGGAVKG